MYRCGLRGTHLYSYIERQTLERVVGLFYHRFHMKEGAKCCGLTHEATYIEDDYRFEYLRAHLKAMKDAVEEDGVDLMGYTCWARSPGVDGNRPDEQALRLYLRQLG